MIKKANHDKAKRLWGIPTLREHLGISESQIRRMARAGILPSVRIGHGRGRILFRPSSIERFIESREAGGDISAKRGRPRRAAYCAPNARATK